MVRAVFVAKLGAEGVWMECVRGHGGGWIERTVYGLRSVNVTRNSLR